MNGCEGVSDDSDGGMDIYEWKLCVMSLQTEI
jgi:hypothetical protein